MKRPDFSRTSELTQRYISQVEGDDLAALLYQRIPETSDFLSGIPEDNWMFSYAPGKWTIKEVAQHLIDTERILCYRALCFARGEGASLPGFDEAAYAAASRANERSKAVLLDELKAVQTATSYLFESFDEEQLEREGIANDTPNYVRAVGFMIVGHVLHHIQILKERYLQ